MPPVRLTRNLRAVWRLLRLLSHLVKGLLKIAFLFPRYSQAQKDQAVQIWALALLRRLGITLRVLGQAPLTGPVLLAANHISWLDIIVMHAARHCHGVCLLFCLCERQQGRLCIVMKRYEQSLESAIAAAGATGLERRKSVSVR